DRNARLSPGTVEMPPSATLPSESRNGTKYHQVAISTVAERRSMHEESVATSSRRARRIVRPSLALTPRAAADIWTSRRPPTASRPAAKSENRKITAGAIVAETPTLNQLTTDSFAKSARPSTWLK